MPITPEITDLQQNASQQYDTHEMDELPDSLYRNSLYYYYLSVYPSLKAMEEVKTEDAPQYPDVIRSAYLHIPFCTGVCDFCSYFLTTVNQEKRAPIEDYFELVKREILTHQKKTHLDISYMYFGGGTPSLVPNHTLESFFKFLIDQKVIASSLFGTFELHPEFFTDIRQAEIFIDILKSVGINRVSIGYQTSDSQILQETNRRHGPAFLQEAIDFLRQKQMLVNLDVMYGLPGTTYQNLERTLREAVTAKPDSISTYFLFLTPGTVMRQDVLKGKIALPSHKESQTQHLMVQLFFEQQGFYELPSDFYAQVEMDPAEFTQDYLPSESASLPLGAGSYGFYDKTQFYNQFSLKKYRDRVKAEESPIWRGRKLDTVGLLHRDVMFSFKNSPYLDRGLCMSKHNIDPVQHFSHIFEILERYKLISLKENRIYLTPKGRLCVEEICALFRDPRLAELDDPSSSRSERKKLDKHNYFPNYPEMK